MRCVHDNDLAVGVGGGWGRRGVGRIIGAELCNFISYIPWHLDYIMVANMTIATVTPH